MCVDAFLAFYGTLDYEWASDGILIPKYIGKVKSDLSKTDLRRKSLCGIFRDTL